MCIATSDAVLNIVHHAVPIPVCIPPTLNLPNLAVISNSPFSPTSPSWSNRKALVLLPVISASIPIIPPATIIPDICLSASSERFPPRKVSARIPKVALLYIGAKNSKLFSISLWNGVCCAISGSKAPVILFMIAPNS